MKIPRVGREPRDGRC